MTTMSERKGSLMQWKGECGHWFVVYSLEPTPPLCPDCGDKQVAKENESRKVLADMVFDIECGNFDEVPSDTELDEWFDDFGVTDPEIRKDIGRLALFVDNIRNDQDHAANEGRRMLKNHPEKLVPKAERLEMP